MHLFHALSIAFAWSIWLLISHGDGIVIEASGLVGILAVWFLLLRMRAKKA